MTLAVFALGAGCVADGSDSSSAATEPPSQPIEETVAEADQCPVIGLPDGYVIVGASPVGAAGDGGR